MQLVTRPALLEELPAGLDCIRDHFLWDAASRPRLLAMWRDLIERRMACTACLDDLDGTLGRHIVAFGVLVFVTPDFAREIRAGRQPYVAQRLLETWERKACPLLSAKQIAQANAGGGVHILNLHSGLPQQYWEAALKDETQPEPVAAAIKQILAQNEAFFTYAISGYRLNEFLIEGYGEKERAYALGMRYAERASLAPALERLGLTPAPNRFPFTVGLDAQEAAAMRGTVLGSLFHHVTPLFGFTMREQELLLFATGGSTDEEIAATLCVSRSTVRKCWRAIYERVEAKQEDFFGLPALKPSAKNRLIAKRRAVIQYVQSHREELRPWAK